MSAVRTTCWRTVGRLRNLYLTAFAVGGFLLLSAALFVYLLNRADGGALAVQAVWAVSVSSCLPFLAILLGMDAWSDERRSGRLDFLLTSPVSEWELVLGKFFGVCFWLGVSILTFFVSTVVFLGIFAPGVLSGVSYVSFVPAVLILLLQGGLWVSLVVALSAFFRHVAVVAAVSGFLLVALPRGLWEALLIWSPQGRAAFGEMPLDAQALDFASGMISTGTAMSYIVLTLAFLLIAAHLVKSFRFIGKGSAQLRLSSTVVCVFALVLAALMSALAIRLNVTADFPLAGERRFSARTREILSEARGNVSVVCLLPRNDAKFRSVVQFLRALKREAEQLGGVRLTLRFVDPRWDIGAATRLMRMGAGSEGLVFVRGQHIVSLPIRDGVGERNCASAILRLLIPPQRRVIYWTQGHGEIAFDSYGADGMSDIARELARDGYDNRPVDLLSLEQIPSDCALVVVAGAKSDFSRTELGLLESYLRQGGRLLTLLGSGDSGGIAAFLPAWGMRAERCPFENVRTYSGRDVVVSDLTDHDITLPLKGLQLVLESPLVIGRTSAVGGIDGVDRIEFAPLAKVGENVVAAIVEKGGGTGTDLAIRPTRIVAIGDATFAVNGQLTVRANANRDFLLNCVSYLSGTDAIVSGGPDVGILSVGLDRAEWRRFVLAFALVPTGIVFLFLVVWARIRRRHRT